MVEQKAATTLCPDEESVACYLTGKASEAERLRVEEHSSRCEACLEELAVLSFMPSELVSEEEKRVPAEVADSSWSEIRTHLGPETPPPKWPLDRLTKLVREVLEQLRFLFSWKGWRLAVIRGDRQQSTEGWVTIRKVMGTLSANIEIERTGEAKANIRVEASGLPQRPGPLRATLFNGKKEVSSLPMQEGSAFFEEIPFGSYRLVLSLEDGRAATWSFELKETHHGTGS